MKFLQQELDRFGVVSPSSRRAWIEIIGDYFGLPTQVTSPSSRRAWIEIYSRTGRRQSALVALLAEGVD